MTNTENTFCDDEWLVALMNYVWISVINDRLSLNAEHFAQEILLPLSDNWY